MIELNLISGAAALASTPGEVSAQAEAAGRFEQELDAAQEQTLANETGEEGEVGDEMEADEGQEAAAEMDHGAADAKKRDDTDETAQNMAAANLSLEQVPLPAEVPQTQGELPEEEGESEEGDLGFEPIPAEEVWQRPEAKPTENGERGDTQQRPKPAVDLVGQQQVPMTTESPGKDALSLLSAGELALAELEVDGTAEPLMGRLQEALATSSVGMDEAAEVVLPQVVRGLATLIREGGAEMRLQLQPADLGEIEVRVKTIEGVVRGQLLVQHAEIKHLIDAQLERLRAALGQQGLELEGFDVGLAGEHSSARQDQSSAEQREGKGLGRRAPDPISSAPPPPVRSDSQAVDLWV